MNANGSCDIAYDDGYNERGVRPSLIRVTESLPTRSSPGRVKFDASDSEAEPRFERGDEVEGRFGGKSKYFGGVIVRVNAGGTYDINYHDGDKERGVPVDYIRGVGGAGVSPSRSSRMNHSDSRTSVNSAASGEVERIRYLFNKEASVTVNSVSLLIRKLSGKAVIGSQRTAISAFARKEGLRPSSKFTLDQFEDLCSELEIGCSSNINEIEPSDDDRPQLKLGDTVKARFGGGSKYFTGCITRVHKNGSCDIYYDDGDKESEVSTALIKSVTKSSSRHHTDTPSADEKLVRGQSVEAKFGGGSKYYTGVIVRVRSDGTYDIDYTDGDAEQHVPMSLIRSIKKSTSQSRVSHSADTLVSFEKGESVEAKFGGGDAFFAGTVKKVRRDGSYDIDYEDGDFEERVNPAIIRKSLLLSVGDKVEATFGEGNAYFSGVITKVRRDGTVDIDYDDGDQESRKPLSKCLLIENSRKKSKSNQGIWDRMRKAAQKQDSDHVVPSEEEIRKEKDEKRKIRKILGVKKYNEMRKSFDKYDKNGDGEITEEEVLMTFKSMGKKCKKRDIREWMDAIDADGSGSVDFVEFVKAYTGIGLSEDEESDRSRRSPRRRARSASDSTRSSASTVSEGHSELWREESWAKRVDTKAIGLLEDGYRDHCIKTRKRKRVLPVKNLRLALNVTGKAASVSQVSEYIRVMGFSKGDTLTLSELVHAYSYMFVDPEKDSFGRSYFDKVWGSETVTVTHRDTETLAALSAQVFRSGEWKGTPRENEILLRKLCIGRGVDQVRTLQTLVKEFETVAGDSSEVPVSEVDGLIRKCGIDPKHIHSTIEDMNKYRTTISLPELISHLGFVFERIDDDPTVAAAFSMMRLHCTPRDAREVGEAVIRIINNIITRPDDAQLWTISPRDNHFKGSIGRHRGGIELVVAVGFETQTMNGNVQRLSLKGVVDKHGRTMVQGVSSDTMSALSLRRDEIERELKTLDGGAVTLNEAIRHLQNECTLVQLRIAVETVLKIVDNILKNPKDSRLWRVRIANDSFVDKIGKWKYGKTLMQSVGFELKGRAGVYTLSGTESPEGLAFKFPELRKDTEDLLWRRKTDLESALRTLEVAIVTGKTHALPGIQKAVPKIVQKENTRKHNSKEEIVHGYSAVEQMQIRMITKAFNKLDKNQDGWITAHDLKLSFSENNQDSSDRAITEWIKERDVDNDGVVSLPEFISSFAHLIPPVVSSVEQPKHIIVNAIGVSETASAFGLLKLLNSVRTVQSVCAAAETLTKKAMKAVKMTKKQSILSKKEISQAFGSALGWHEVLCALSWRYNESDESFSYKRSSYVEDRLRELEAHVKGLYFLDVADVRAAVGAMSNLIGSSPSTKTNGPGSWLEAITTVIKYLRNIVQSPKEMKFRIINTTNANFRKQIGRLEHGTHLLTAVDFRENEDATLSLHRDNFTLLESRIIELEAGIDILQQRANTERKKSTKAQNQNKDQTNHLLNKPSENPKIVENSPPAEVSFAQQRIEKLRIRELEAQVAVLKNSLREGNEIPTKPKPADDISVTLTTYNSFQKAGAGSGGAPSMRTDHKSSRTVVSSSIASKVHRGASILPLTSLVGYKYGDMVMIGHSDKENRFVVGFVNEGIALDQPIRMDHDAGEQVFVSKASPAELQMFKKHEKVQFVMNIVGSMVDTASRMGSVRLETLCLQNQFQTRPLSKHVFCTARVLDLDFPQSTQLGLASIGEKLLVHNTDSQVMILEERFHPSELRELFELIDCDGDRRISKEDILRAGAIEPRVAALHRCESNFRQTVMDMQGDDFLSWARFLGFFNSDVAISLVKHRDPAWWEEVNTWRGASCFTRLDNEDIEYLSTYFCLFCSGSKMKESEWEAACFFMDGHHPSLVISGPLNFPDFCRSRVLMAKKLHHMQSLVTLLKGTSVLDTCRLEIRRVFASVSGGEESALRLPLLKGLFQDGVIACLLGIQVGRDSLEQRFQLLGESTIQRDTIDWYELARCLWPNDSVDTCRLFGSSELVTVEVPPAVQLLVEPELKRVFVLRRDGVIDVYDASLSQRIFTADQVTYAVTDLAYLKQTRKHIMSLDDSILVLDLTPASGNVYFLDSLALTLQRKTHLKVSLSETQQGLYIAKWDIFACAVAHGMVGLFCALSGTLVAQVSACDKPATSAAPQILYDKLSGFLVTAHKTALKFWDLGDQINWRMKDETNSLGRIAEGLSALTSLRPAIVLSSTSDRVTVRYTSAGGGLDYDIDVSRIIEGKVMAGEAVMVGKDTRLMVTVSKVYSGVLDVVVNSNGVGLSQVPMPEQPVQIGDEIEIKAPANYFDAHWIFEAMDLDGDGSISVEEFASVLISKFALDLPSGDLQRVFNFLDSNEDGRISIRELTAALGRLNTRSRRDETVKHLACRHFTKLSHPVQSMEYLVSCGLLVVATTNQRILVFDPVAKPHRLTHPRYQLGESEWTMSNTGFQSVLEINCGIDISNLFIGEYSLPPLSEDLGIMLDAGQLSSIAAAEKMSSLRGFCYVFSNGDTIAIECSEFDPRLALVGDRALFGKRSCMTHVGGWQAGNDNLRTVYNRRHEIRRVLYMITSEVPTLAQALEVLISRKVCNMTLDSMRKCLVAPHIQIFGFYTQGDGPSKTLSTSDFSQASLQEGTVTRKLDERVFEVAFETNLLKVSADMLEVVDSEDPTLIGVGSHVRIQTMSKANPLPISNSLQFLFVQCKCKNGRQRLLAYHVGRTSVSVPAFHYDDPFDPAVEAAVNQSFTHNLICQLQIWRTSLSSMREEDNAIKLEEKNMAREIASLLQLQSLQIEKQDDLAHAKAAFKISLRLPCRWGRQFRSMEKHIENLFHEVAITHNRAKIEDLLDALESRMKDGDLLSSHGLKLLSRSSLLANWDEDEVFITLRQFKDLAVRTHFSWIAPAELFDILRQIHYTPEKETCSEDIVDEAGFLRVLSHLDPLWSLRDKLHEIANLKFTAPKEGGFDKLASLIEKHKWSEHLLASKVQLSSLANVLIVRGTTLVAEAFKLQQHDIADAVVPAQELISKCRLNGRNIAFHISSAPCQFLSSHSQLVYRVYSNMLRVHVISEENLSRLCSDDEPYEVKLERELHLYSVLENVQGIPSLVEASKPRERMPGRYFALQDRPGWLPLGDLFLKHGYLSNHIPLLRLWACQLAQILSSLHANGVALRGPSPNQVLVSPCGMFVELASLQTAVLVDKSMFENVSDFEGRYYNNSNDITLFEYDTWCLGSLMLESLSGNRLMGANMFSCFDNSSQDFGRKLPCSSFQLGSKGQFVLTVDDSVVAGTGNCISKGTFSLLIDSKSTSDFGQFSTTEQVKNFAGAKNIQLSETDLDELNQSNELTQTAHKIFSRTRDMSLLTLDCIALCLQNKFSPTELTYLPFFHTTVYDSERALECAEAYMASQLGHIRLQQAIHIPLAILRAQSTGGTSTKWVGGSCDPRMLLNVVDSCVTACSSSSAPGSVIVALMDVTELVLRLVGSPFAEERGRGVVAGAGFVEGNASDTLGIRVLKRVVAAFRTIAKQLVLPDSPLTPHIGKLLHAAFCLYIGRIDIVNTEGEDEGDTSISYWSAELQSTVSPLLVDLLTEEGGGNTRYNGVSECLSQWTDHSSFSRSSGYCSRILQAGRALTQLYTAKRGSRTRVVASRQLFTLLEANETSVLQLCIDNRVAVKAAGLVSDPYLHEDAMVCGTMLLQNVPHISNAFSHLSGSSRLKKRLALEFASVHVVTALVQWLLQGSIPEETKRVSMGLLAAQVNSRMTDSWPCTDIFPVLQNLVCKKGDIDAVNLCVRILASGHAELVSQFYSFSNLVESLRENFDVEFPAMNLLDEVQIDDMEDLFIEIRDVSTVIRMDAVLTKVLFIIESNFLWEGDPQISVFLSEILEYIWSEWFLSSWSSVIDDVSLEESRLPLLWKIYLLSSSAVKIVPAAVHMVLTKCIQMRPVYLLDFSVDLLELWSDMMLYLGLNKVHDIEHTFRVYLETGASLVRECVRSERHSRLLGFVQKFRLGSRNVLSALLDNEGLSHDLMQSIVGNYLPDETWVEEFQHFPLRDNAISFIRIIFRSGSDKHIRELIGLLKSHGTIRRERDRIWKSEREIDVRSSVSLLRELARTRHPLLQQDLISQAEMPTALVYDELTVDGMWLEWQAVVSRSRMLDVVPTQQPRAPEIKHVLRVEIPKKNTKVVYEELSLNSTEVIDQLGEAILEADQLFDKYSKKIQQREPVWTVSEVKRFLKENKPFRVHSKVAKAMLADLPKIAKVDFYRFFLRVHKTIQKVTPKKQMFVSPEAAVLFDEYSEDGSTISLPGCAEAFGTFDRTVLVSEVKSLAMSLSFLSNSKFNLDQFHLLLEQWKNTQAESPATWFSNNASGLNSVNDKTAIAKFLATTSRAPSERLIQAWCKKHAASGRVNLTKTEFMKLYEWSANLDPKQDCEESSKLPSVTLVSTRFRTHASSQQQSLDSIPAELKSKIGDAKLEALWHAFAKYDLNSDGKISFLELRTAFNEMGRVSVPDEELYSWIRERDTRNSGCVFFRDFVTSYVHQLPDERESREETESVPPSAPLISRGLGTLQTLFQQYDRDGDGWISPDDLRAAFPSMSDNELRNWIDDKDTTGTGKVSVTDFCLAYSDTLDVALISRVRAAFDRLDVAAAGVIPASKLASLFNRLGWSAPNINRSIQDWVKKHSMDQVGLEDVLQAYHHIFESGMSSSTKTTERKK